MESVEGLHINSPLVESGPLSSILGKTKVYLKMDSLQPSGSFKIRGISYRCIKAIKESKCNHIVCSSGGNAGKFNNSVQHSI
jgi:L-serine/L-threonine ammonia-lyase